MTRNYDDLAPELHELARQLDDERPELAQMRLDELKLGILRRAGRRPSAYPKGKFMRSRLALTSILVLGLTFTGAGGTVAVTGLAGDGNAGTAQYGGVQGQNDGGGNDEVGAVLGNVDSGSTTGGATDAQQVAETGDDSLPFTGFAAIPLLVGGVALLGTGAALRRSQRQGS
jgi:hypothetical protein